MVEVDRDTGQVEIIRYVAVDDVGNVINPMIVDGQLHGGIAQGIAQALYEGAVYADNGELITATMNDYAIPKASMLPPYELDRTVPTTTVNPMGARGGRSRNDRLDPSGRQRGHRRALPRSATWMHAVHAGACLARHARAGRGVVLAGLETDSRRYGRRRDRGVPKPV